MSALPRFPAELGYAGLRMTASEFSALDETEEKYELVHGVVVMSPPSDPAHGDVGSFIITELMNFGCRVFSEIDLRVSEDTVYRPDVCAYKPGRVRGRIPRLPPAPDLVVEVLSPATKAMDLITKKSDYERSGVGEYWTVDPQTLQVRCWMRTDGQLLERPVVGESIACETIPGFVLSLKKLREVFGE